MWIVETNLYNKNSFMWGLSNILNIENLLNKNIFLILCLSIKSYLEYTIVYLCFNLFIENSLMKRFLVIIQTSNCILFYCLYTNFCGEE